MFSWSHVFRQVMKPMFDTLYTLRNIAIHVTLIHKLIKGIISDSNPIHFLSDSANISSQSSSCPFSLCTEKNLVFLHSPDSYSQMLS